MQYALVPLLAAAALAVGTGCIDTDATVFVDASIASPSAAVTAATLGTQLSGGFQLQLHLGPRASGPSEVTLRSFEINNAAQTTAIISPLEAVTSVSLPIKVDLDSDVSVPFTFDTGADLLPSEVQAPLCDPGGLRITGTIQDSLQDGATPVASEIFQAACM